MLLKQAVRVALNFSLALSLAGQFIDRGMGESIPLGEGVSAVFEGDYKSLEKRRFSLAKGAALKVIGSPGITEQRLTAFSEGVEVRCDDLGVAFASGLFALEFRMTDGVVFRVPGKITATRMRLTPKPEDALVFTTSADVAPTSPRWVSWADGYFRVYGQTSAEAVHPPLNGNQEFLVSMGGETDQVWMTSDLKTGAMLEGSRADFWREAYGDLNRKRRTLREMVIGGDRIGAAGYQAFVREAMEGLSKLGEGYRLLQSKQYTDEVLRRMIQSGTAIPRLVLASFNIVIGDAAFSLQPFQNWVGQGKVIANVAYLTNEKHPAPGQPPFTFTLEDRSRIMNHDIRLVVSEDDAVIETRPRADKEWAVRSPDQFDLIAEVGFAPAKDSFVLSLDVDATGYLLRKAQRVVGQISLGTLELKRDSLTVHYRPTAPSPTVATRFSSFLSLRRILFIPDKDKILSPYRPEQISEETWDFLGEAIDFAVDALHRARIDQIDEFKVVLAKENDRAWRIFAEAADPSGRRARAEHGAELAEDPLGELWRRTQGSREASGWLDLDLGFLDF